MRIDTVEDLKRIANLILIDNEIADRIIELVIERDIGPWVCVSGPGGGFCYHEYGCGAIKGEGKEISLETAKYLGYSPCRICQSSGV